MLIPSCEPVVYVGKNLRDDDKGDAVYFQDAESYLRGVRRESATPDDEATFNSGAEPKQIFEYEPTFFQQQA